MNEVIARGHSAANTLCSSFHTLRRTGGQKNEQMEAFIPFDNPVLVTGRVLFSKIAAKVTFFGKQRSVIGNVAAGVSFRAQRGGRGAARSGFIRVHRCALDGTFVELSRIKIENLDGLSGKAGASEARSGGLFHPGSRNGPPPCALSGPL